MAETVSGKVAGNISSVYSMIRQKTSDIQDTFESLASITGADKQKGTTPLSALSSESDDNLSMRSTKTISADNKSMTRNESAESDSLAECDNLKEERHSPTPTPSSIGTIESKEDELVYLVTNVLFTILWRGIESSGGDAWKERGQVIACLNLLGLNNELYCSHLTLRLRILELGAQAVLIDLSESGSQMLSYQENAAQWLRMIYDLVVLDPNENDAKKCSPKLMDGVLAIMGKNPIEIYAESLALTISIRFCRFSDALIVFQQSAADDWTEMSRLCLGLLMKCSHNPNVDIVAMATAKLHSILQIRTTQDPQEIGYLFFSINKALSAAIEGEAQFSAQDSNVSYILTFSVGNCEEYSFLMPIMKALLEKTSSILNLSTNVPDLPPISSGPVFFEQFQMYSVTRQWTSFIEKMVSKSRLHFVCFK